MLWNHNDKISDSYQVNFELFQFRVLLLGASVAVIRHDRQWSHSR